MDDTELTKGQQEAFRQLKEIEHYSNGLFEVKGEYVQFENSDYKLVFVSISCREFKKGSNGIDLNIREPFIVMVPKNFPFKKPLVCTGHKRFGGRAHVLWEHWLCLYQAETEWNPSDGMFGFIDRLADWLRDAALDKLDPQGEPLHPPVAYVSKDYWTVVIRPNTPTVNESYWLGVAELNRLNEDTFEVKRWLRPSESAGTQLSGAVYLLNCNFPFEYPKTVDQLLKLLTERGLSVGSFLFGLQLASFQSPKDSPLFIFIGTPQRGIHGETKLQHLSAWKIDGTLRKAVDLSINKFNKDSIISDIGEEAEKLLLEWLEKTEIKWCRIMEDRPEIVIRRDSESITKILDNKKIALLGCGALGSHIGKILVKAGVKQIHLYDNGRVSPGILCRQDYSISDIGKKKVNVLEKQLAGLVRNLIVIANDVDISEDIESHTETLSSVDLIIDATASNLVEYKLEELTEHGKMPAIASVSVGHECSKALITYRPDSMRGGTFEVLRNMKIKLASIPSLAAFYSDFWPPVPRTTLFHPEPGCSEPTFIGSFSDVSMLASISMNEICNIMKESCVDTSVGICVDKNVFGLQIHRYKFTDYIELKDGIQDFRVKVSPFAHRQILSSIRSAARKRGSKKETGGILLGQLDDFLRIVWIDHILDAPPDSKFSENQFLCGIRGVDETIAKLKKATRGALGYLGTWHTHPISRGEPSINDLSAACSLLHETEKPRRNIVFLIVGFSSQKPDIKSYVFNRDDIERGSINE